MIKGAATCLLAGSFLPDFTNSHRAVNHVTASTVRMMYKDYLFSFDKTSLPRLRVNVIKPTTEFYICFAAHDDDRRLYRGAITVSGLFACASRSS